MNKPAQLNYQWPPWPPTASLLNHLTPPSREPGPGAGEGATVQGRGGQVRTASSAGGEGAARQGRGDLLPLFYFSATPPPWVSLSTKTIKMPAPLHICLQVHFHNPRPRRTGSFLVNVTRWHTTSSSLWSGPSPNLGPRHHPPPQPWLQWW